MKIRYLDLYTTDPYFNLACEQFVFDELPRDCSYVMLWQNSSTIVIGKYQNTYSQINTDYVRENGIKVARRLSGGGAVYHDMGNLNYTFITDAESMEGLNMQLFCRPVVRTLERLGVPAQINGRNDITIDGKKFSGNSQYVKSNRVMHHGTILFDADLSAVGKALQVDESKIQSKGIRSVRSRVTNVRPYLPDDSITLPAFRQLLLEEMLTGFDAEEQVLSEADIAKINTLREKYASWEWNYGRSPEFTVRRSRRFEGCGQLDVCLTAEGGTVSDVTFYGDYFSFKEPELLSQKLIGLCLSEEAFSGVLLREDPSVYFSGIDREAFIEFMMSFI